MNTLQKIQNTLLRFPLGYQCTTPINVIMAESCIPYLKYRFEYLGYKYILKNLSYASNSVINSIAVVYELLENPVYQLNFEKSLIVQCYEQSWFKRDLILNYENYYKFTLSYDSIMLVLQLMAKLLPKMVFFTVLRNNKRRTPIFILSTFRTYLCPSSGF